MKSLKTKRAWIFDLDGTLTQPVHDFAHIRAELGIAPEEDILSTIECQPPEVKRTMIMQLDRLERYYAAQAAPALGVSRFLQLLVDKKCRLGILTRNTKEMAKLSLKAINAIHNFRCEDILGREETQPKPAPDGINFLLNQWGIQQDDVVMVGDYHFDLLSGRAAGVTTVHVDTSDRHWPDDTDVRVKNLLELVSLVTE